MRKGFPKDNQSRGNTMEVLIIDIWLEKIRRGWKIEDIPEEYKELRKELRKRLEEKELCH